MQPSLTGQVVGTADHRRSQLRGARSGQAALREHGVRAPVQRHPTLGHDLVMQVEGPAVLPVVEAGSHQTAVRLDVGLDTVAFAHLFHQLESLPQAAHATQQLDGDADGVVRWGDAFLAHLTKELHALLHAALLRTALEQGVVGELVRLDICLVAHKAQDLQASSQAPGHTRPFDDG